MALIVLLFNIACNFSVAPFFDWLVAPSVVDELGDGVEIIFGASSDFFVSLGDVDELFDCDGFGDEARAF